MAAYRLPRGTTWPITVTITRVSGPGVAPTPVNLTGHHVVATVRIILKDGTVDGTIPPVWQGDTTAGGVVLANQATQPGVCFVTMPASATQALPNPTDQGTPLYYDITDGDGAGNEFQTEFGTILLLPRVTLSQP